MLEIQENVKDTHTHHAFKIIHCMANGNTERALGKVGKVEHYEEKEKMALVKKTERSPTEARDHEFIQQILTEHLP